MIFNIAIDIEGDAFQETDQELCRILRELCVKIDRGDDCLPCTLGDINGNACGRAWIVDRADLEG